MIGEGRLRDARRPSFFCARIARRYTIVGIVTGRLPHTVSRTDARRAFPQSEVYLWPTETKLSVPLREKSAGIAIAMVYMLPTEVQPGDSVDAADGAAGDTNTVTRNTAQARQPLPTAALDREPTDVKSAARLSPELLSSISHEIHAPLNAILGMADLLTETELGPEQRRYVSAIVNNGNALSSLINNLLDLAKVESGCLSLESTAEPKSRNGEHVAAVQPAPRNDAGCAVLDRPLRILMVDDSLDNRALVRAYLRKTPYRIDEAEDGEAAVRKFREQRYDLILMDIQMPVMDGCTATRQIRKLEAEGHLPHTPIIALTGSALDDAVRKTREAGCDAHVAKPVRKAQLLGAIRAAVEAREAAATVPALSSAPRPPEPAR